MSGVDADEMWMLFDLTLRKNSACLCASSLDASRTGEQ
jgi:hypothetical protein